MDSRIEICDVLSQRCCFIRFQVMKLWPSWQFLTLVVFEDITVMAHLSWQPASQANTNVKSQKVRNWSLAASATELSVLLSCISLTASHEEGVGRSGNHTFHTSSQEKSFFRTSPCMRQCCMLTTRHQHGESGNFRPTF